MSEPRLQLAPDIADLAALGADSPEALLGTGGRLWGAGRAQVVGRSDDHELLRVPLPGTSTDGLNLLGSPAGAGTGWIYVRRYRSTPFLERARHRLTQPRSQSAAERDWNLLCLLRAAGITTPEPLAVASEAHPLYSPRSALVTRELSDFRPALEWLAMAEDPVLRNAGLASLGRLLGRLRRAGVQVGGLRADALHLALPEDDSSCHGPPVGEGRLRWRRAPEAALTGLRRARLTPRGVQVEVLDALWKEVAEKLDLRDGFRVRYHAHRDLPRTARRRFAPRS